LGTFAHMSQRCDHCVCEQIQDEVRRQAYGFTVDWYGKDQAVNYRLISRTVGLNVPRCHDESLYQLKHGLLASMSHGPPSPPIKVCLTSPPSPREKEATAQATPRGDVVLRLLAV